VRSWFRKRITEERRRAKGERRKGTRKKGEVEEEVTEETERDHSRGRLFHIIRKVELRA